jgi:hypothetical protein
MNDERSAELKALLAANSEVFDKFADLLNNPSRCILI